MAPRTTLRKTIENKGRKNAPRNARSALLNMPIELIREFSDELSPVDKILFTATCRPIRNTLGLSQLSDEEWELREQQFEYLARIGRDMPHKWFCEECMRHHPINMSDTPASPLLSCPVGKLDRSEFNSSLRLIARGEYRLGRRHVQLALKYTRLGKDISPRNRQYLGRLMASRQYSYSYMWNNETIYNAVRIAPRVVDGRFLLKCIFEYRGNGRRVEREIMAGEFVCRHQSFLPENVVSDGPLLKFHKAVVDAFGKPGREVHSHCPHCYTDFSIKASVRGVRLTVWHDLGTESSALDPVWRAFVYSSHLYPDGDELVNYEPGRVRELYDGEEE